MTRRHSTHSTLTTHPTQCHPLREHRARRASLTRRCPVGPLFYSFSPQPTPGQLLYARFKIQSKYPTPHRCPLELFRYHSHTTSLHLTQKLSAGLPWWFSDYDSRLLRQGVWVPPLAGEPSFHRLCSAVKKKNYLCIPSGCFHSFCSFSSMC